MDSSQNTSLIRRLGRIVSLTALTAGAVAALVYFTQRPRDTRPIDVVSAEASGSRNAQAAAPTTDNPADIAQVESAQEAQGPTVTQIQQDTTTRPLEEFTFEELYRLAQRSDLAGRSSMRKAQLIEALQAEGLTQAQV